MALALLLLHLKNHLHPTLGVELISLSFFIGVHSHYHQSPSVKEVHSHAHHGHAPPFAPLSLPSSNSYDQLGQIIDTLVCQAAVEQVLRTGANSSQFFWDDVDNLP